MPVFSFQQLIDTGVQIFTAAGCDGAEAHAVSRSLVGSNLAGHDSHGIIRIPDYVKAIKKGDMIPGAGVTVVRKTETTAALDGNWGIGQVVGRQAMETAVDMAKSNTVAVVTLRQSNHVARLGEYAAMAAENGMIGIVMANGHGAGHSVAPWGGRERRLTTTPISIAAPSDSGRTVLMDFCTAVSAEGKLRVARNRGKELAEGTIIDADGKPSTDPHAFYGPPRGALLPFGGHVGHKGFALSFMIEILGGILSGAGASRANPGRFGNAVFMVAVDIAGFLPLPEFTRQVEDFIAYVKSCPRIPGVEEIFFPGEIEYNEREKRMREGVFVGDDTWSLIVETARGLGTEIKITDGQE